MALFGVLQQLGHGGHCDQLGRLAGDAFDADRADHAPNRFGCDPFLLESMHEALPLGLGADQPEETEVTAAQDRLGDAQVQVVVVRQHQVVCAGRRMAHLVFDRVDAEPADVRRPWFLRTEQRRELGIALVDPVDDHVEPGQQRGDGAADMAGAVQLQMKERRHDRPARELGLIEQRVAQRHRAAAALAQRRAEREVLAARRALATAQHLSRRLQCLELEVAAADGAQHLCRADEHARSRFPRRRALRFAHLDDHGRLAAAKPAFGGNACLAVHHGWAAFTALMASRMASAVAGARSGGSTRCPPTAETASRIAKNTENGSSSGGSPTALLRWMLSSTLLFSYSFTLNTGGQSLAVGIL